MREGITIFSSDFHMNRPRQSFFVMFKVLELYISRRNSVGTTLVEVPTLPNYKRIVHWTTCILHQYFTKYKLSEYVIVRIYHSRGKTQYFRYLPYSYRAEVRATVEIHYCKPIKRNIDARISFVFQESKKHPPPLIKSVLNFF